MASTISCDVGEVYIYDSLYRNITDVTKHTLNKIYLQLQQSTTYQLFQPQKELQIAVYLQLLLPRISHMEKIQTCWPVNNIWIKIPYILLFCLYLKQN
uniref:Uncharacterized protein n=1 Tax=Amphimedon queenslandica TaxID=400682 RepID=A0A1X7U4X9_AMPQE